MTIEKMYHNKCNHPSDINQLLPILKHYADRCSHVTEMGTRYFVSTYALLHSKAKEVVAYDIEIQRKEWEECKRLCDLEGKNFKYIIADVLKVEIEETDLLFIDTFHEYGQLKKELELHADKARKYIAFHDTETYWNIGETQYHNVKASGGFSQENKGLGNAIEEFLESHPEWEIELNTAINNGLMILKRK